MKTATLIASMLILGNVAVASDSGGLELNAAVCESGNCIHAERPPCEGNNCLKGTETMECDSAHCFRIIQLP
jgi:hypothetical protein